MGATWFVSRAFHEYIDTNHLNWKRVTTHNNRNSVYRNCREKHRYFLERIIEMKDENLNKNTIGLSGIKVKAMANSILQKFYN